MVVAQQTVLDGLVFPEGPRWHEGKLWFSDMHGGTVHSMVPGAPAVLEATIDDDMPSGLGFLPDGSLLVVARRRCQVLRRDPESGELAVHADLGGFPIDSLNDMVTGPDGRSYVGGRIERGYSPESFDVDPKAGRTEVVILVEPDGSPILAADGLIGPNGSVITPDGGALLVAESRGRRITRFPIGGDGTLGERSLFADTRDYFPDGMCLDEAGAVWIGAPMANRFLRIEDGGAITDVIETADRWAVACVLGGADRRTLYMMTAYNTLENLSALAEGAAESTARGFVESMEVSVPGAGWP